MLVTDRRKAKLAHSYVSNYPLFMDKNIAREKIWCLVVPDRIFAKKFIGEMILKPSFVHNRMTESNIVEEILLETTKPMIYFHDKRLSKKVLEIILETWTTFDVKRPVIVIFVDEVPKELKTNFFEITFNGDNYTEISMEEIVPHNSTIKEVERIFDELLETFDNSIEKSLIGPMACMFPILSDEGKGQVIETAKVLTDEDENSMNDDVDVDWIDSKFFEALTCKKIYGRSSDEVISSSEIENIIVCKGNYFHVSESQLKKILEMDDGPSISSIKIMLEKEEIIKKTKTGYTSKVTISIDGVTKRVRMIKLSASKLVKTKSFFI